MLSLTGLRASDRLASPSPCLSPRHCVLDSSSESVPKRWRVGVGNRGAALEPCPAMRGACWLFGALPRVATSCRLDPPWRLEAVAPTQQHRPHSAQTGRCLRSSAFPVVFVKQVPRAFLLLSWSPCFLCFVLPNGLLLRIHCRCL